MEGRGGGEISGGKRRRGQEGNGINGDKRCHHEFLFLKGMYRV